MGTDLGAVREDITQNETNCTRHRQARQAKPKSPPKAIAARVIAPRSCARRIPLLHTIFRQLHQREKKGNNRIKFITQRGKHTSQTNSWEAKTNY